MALVTQEWAHVGRDGPVQIHTVNFVSASLLIVERWILIYQVVPDSCLLLLPRLIISWINCNFIRKWRLFLKYNGCGRYYKSLLIVISHIAIHFCLITPNLITLNRAFQVLLAMQLGLNGLTPAHLLLMPINSHLLLLTPTNSPLSLTILGHSAQNLTFSTIILANYAVLL